MQLARWCDQNGEHAMTMVLCTLLAGIISLSAVAFMHYVDWVLRGAQPEDPPPEGGIPHDISAGFACADYFIKQILLRFQICQHLIYRTLTSRRSCSGSAHTPFWLINFQIYSRVMLHTHYS